MQIIGRRLIRGFTLTLSLGILSLSGAAMAERVEVTVLGGVQFGGSSNFIGGEASFAAGPEFAALLGVRVNKQGLITLGYQRQWTEVDFRILQLSNPIWGKRDMTVGTIHFGGELELPVNDRVIPFIGVSLGATHYSAEFPNSTSWYFSGAFTGGLKLKLTKHIGLRSQMRLLGTVINNDSTVFCVSSGGLTCAIAADLDGVVQGDFLAGVYVTF
jgi:hypothetical protein